MKRSGDLRLSSAMGARWDFLLGASLNEAERLKSVQEEPRRSHGPKSSNRGLRLLQQRSEGQSPLRGQTRRRRHNGRLNLSNILVASLVLNASRDAKIRVHPQILHRERNRETARLRHRPHRPLRLLPAKPETRPTGAIIPVGIAADTTDVRN